MPSPPLDPQDRARFGLTMISNLMLGQRGEGLEQRLYQGIRFWLNADYGKQVLQGDWHVAWGPGIKQFTTDLYAVNAMYVAKEGLPGADPERPRYVIAIAGTNPTSPFDWLIEDFATGVLVDWLPTPAGQPRARISLGTAIGLSYLLALKPTDDRPGASTGLLDFLWEATAHGTREIDLWVCGHSLGGALAPTLALWLQEPGWVRSHWDPNHKATIRTMPMACASPGNVEFADRVEAAFPGDHTRRYCNSLDVVPHAWEAEHLDEVPGLYRPQVPVRPLVQAIIGFFKAQCAHGNYADVRSPVAEILGAFQWCRHDPNGIHFLNFVNQMVYQHIHAYFDYFQVLGGEMLDQIPPIPATGWEMLMSLLRELGIAGSWAPTETPVDSPPPPSFRSLGLLTSAAGRSVIQQLPLVRLLPRVGVLAPLTLPSPADGRPVRVSRRRAGRTTREVQSQLQHQQHQAIQRSPDPITKP